MRVPRPSTRPWVAAAGVIAAAAILVTVLHQGTATAQTDPPDAPANALAHLIVPDGEDPRIRVSWDGSDTGATGYTITRGDGQTFDADGTKTTFSDHSVEPGTAYSYTVTANSGQGNSPASEAASASVANAPSTPGNLNAAVAESTAADETASVTLTWTASSVPPVEQCDVAYPLDGYTVSRSDGTDEVDLGTTGAGVTSFTDPNAGFRSNYTYRVAARSAIGTSPAAEAATTIPSRPMLPPTGLTATITDPFDGNVSLSWSAPAAGPEVAGYLVLRYDGADPLAGNAIPTTLAELATETTLVDSTVNAGSAYSYVVIALSADNVSEPAHSAAIEPPAPPTGLAATAANGTIGLSWTAPDAGAVGTYRVERQPQDGQWAHLADATATSHDDATAADNATYAYRVQHRNDHGGSTWSESDAVTLVVAPSAPTSVSATASGSDNVLTWTAPDSPFIDGYRVRHRTGDGDWASLADNIAADTVTHTHQDAAADVTHHYAVRAHNSAGNGPWSDTASTGRVTPPVAPTGVNAALSDDDIVLTWTRPSSVHVDGYTVRHQAGADQEFVASERLAGTATSYTIADITGDTLYTLAVRAHNSGGDGPWSEAVEIERVLMPSRTHQRECRGRRREHHPELVRARNRPRRRLPRQLRRRRIRGTTDCEHRRGADLLRPHGQRGGHRLRVPGTRPQLRRQRALVGRRAGNQAAGSRRAVEPGSRRQRRQHRRHLAGAGRQHRRQLRHRVRPVLRHRTRHRVGFRRARLLHPHRQPGRRRVPVPRPLRQRRRKQPVDRRRHRNARAVARQAHRRGRRHQRRQHRGDVECAAERVHRRIPRRAAPAKSRRLDPAHRDGRHRLHPRVSRRRRHLRVPRPDVQRRRRQQLERQGHRHLVRGRRPARVGLRPALEQQHAAAHPLDTIGNQRRVRLRGQAPRGRRRMVQPDHGRDTRLPRLGLPTAENLREYSVRSQKDDAYGDWSAIRKFTIAQPSAVAGVVTNLEGTNGVRLHWDEPDSGQPTQYFIEYNTGNGNWVRSGTLRRLPAHPPVRQPALRLDLLVPRHGRQRRLPDRTGRPDHGHDGG